MANFTIFNQFRMLALLMISIACSPLLHAKSAIETQKLLYLRTALIGKTLEPRRIATLLGVTALAAAQIGSVAYLAERTIRNKPLIPSFIKPEWRNALYQKCGITNHSNPDKLLKEYLAGVFAILSILNIYPIMPIAIPTMYLTKQQFRPTTNLRGLKYPFLFGWNTPGIILYHFCQNRFFDYRHNLIKLLKNYNRDLIPTVFQETFDKLAAEYKEKKRLPLSNYGQHFFVLKTLQKIQEELLEEVTIQSFSINHEIEEIISKIKHELIVELTTFSLKKALS